MGIESPLMNPPFIAGYHALSALSGLSFVLGLAKLPFSGDIGKCRCVRSEHFLCIVAPLPCLQSGCQAQRGIERLSSRTKHEKSLLNLQRSSFTRLITMSCRRCEHKRIVLLNYLAGEGTWALKPCTNDFAQEMHTCELKPSIW